MKGKIDPIDLLIKALGYILTAAVAAALTLLICTGTGAAGNPLCGADAETALIWQGAGGYI